MATVVSKTYQEVRFDAAKLAIDRAEVAMRGAAPNIDVARQALESGEAALKDAVGGYNAVDIADLAVRASAVRQDITTACNGVLEARLKRNPFHTPYP